MTSGAGRPGSYPGGTWTVTGRSPPTRTSGELEGTADGRGEADGPNADGAAVGNVASGGALDEFAPAQAATNTATSPTGHRVPTLRDPFDRFEHHVLRKLHPVQPSVQPVHLEELVL